MLPELLPEVSCEAEADDDGCGAEAGFSEEVFVEAAVVAESVSAAVFVVLFDAAKAADAVLASVEDVDDIGVASELDWFCNRLKVSLLISAVSPSSDVETVVEELADAEVSSSFVVVSLDVVVLVALDSTLDVTLDKILVRLFVLALMDEIIF
ncbi:MAG: hypothetical protein WCP73_07715 [Eubacteriales bacterium]